MEQNAKMLRMLNYLLVKNDFEINTNFNWKEVKSININPSFSRKIIKVDNNTARVQISFLVDKSNEYLRSNTP